MVGIIFHSEEPRIPSWEEPINEGKMYEEYLSISDLRRYRNAQHDLMPESMKKPSKRKPTV